MELRYYQEEAKRAIYQFFKENPDKNPCVVLPTGAGKTPLLASICQDIVIKRAQITGRKNRVLVVSHVKELLEQARDKLQLFAPDVKVGVYSAGLNSRDTTEDVIVAGVQSIYDKSFLLGRFDVVIIDECHLIPPDGDGRYQTLLKSLRIANPHVKLVGLTATPYRLKTGLLCGEDKFLNEICYEVDVAKLISEGYLSRLESKFTHNGVDTSQLHIRAGEFVQEEVETLMNNETTVDKAVREIVEKKKQFGRKKCLIFASSVKHANNIKAKVEALTGEECGYVIGDLGKKERDEAIQLFRDGKVKYLVNVSVLTTGFDDPSVDMIALLRPTASPGLYYQMCGRGLRIADGKDYCMILDFGQNIERHGPIDEIHIKTKKRKKGSKPVKVCPQCETYCHANATKCETCGFVFPINEEDHLTGESSKKNVLSKPYIDYDIGVVSTEYFKHLGKNDKILIKAVHHLEDGSTQIEWLCPEHDGFARRSFVKWWFARTKLAPPETVDRALELLQMDVVAHTELLTIRHTDGEKYNKIINWEVQPYHKNYSRDVKARFCKLCVFNNNGTCVKHNKEVTDRDFCGDFKDRLEVLNRGDNF